MFFEFEGILKQAILKEGNYTTAELAPALNTAIITALSPPPVLGVNPFAVTYYKPTNAIIIQWNPVYVATTGSGYTTGKLFYIPTDYELTFRGATQQATKKKYQHLTEELHAVCAVLINKTFRFRLC